MSRKENISQTDYNFDDAIRSSSIERLYKVCNMFKKQVEYSDFIKNAKDIAINTKMIAVGSAPILLNMPAWMQGVGFLLLSTALFRAKDNSSGGIYEKVPTLPLIEKVDMAKKIIEDEISTNFAGKDSLKVDEARSILKEVGYAIQSEQETNKPPKSCHRKQARPSKLVRYDF